jgi:hypothetical protein
MDFQASLKSFSAECWPNEESLQVFRDPNLYRMSLILKSPKRAEALGLALILALLIWRLLDAPCEKTSTEPNLSSQSWD